MKIIIFVKKGDMEIGWDECSQTEKQELSEIMNKQGLRALGYVPI